MSTEASILLTHQLTDPLCEELFGLLLKSLHHHGLDNNVLSL
jgi:hypothetical protein